MRLLRAIGKEGTVTPMGAGGESMLTGYEPSGNSGGNGIEFELHRDFIAVAHFFDLVPSLFVFGWIERQTLYNKTSVSIFQSSVGEVKALHQA